MAESQVADRESSGSDDGVSRYMEGLVPVGTQGPGPDKLSYVAERFDTKTFQVLDRRYYTEPIESHRRQDNVELMSNRYLVVTNNETIDYLDLNTAGSQFVRLTLPDSPAPSIVLKTNSLIVTERMWPSLNKWEIDVYGFSNEGVLSRLDTWEGRSARPILCLDMLLTLDDEERVFKLYSAETGKLIRTIDFPIDFHPATSTYWLNPNATGVMLTYQTNAQQKYFDVFLQKEVVVPPGMQLEYGALPDGSLRLLRDDQLHVWEPSTGRLLAKIPWEIEQARILNREQLLIVSKALGRSFHLYDPVTGKHLQSYRPFFWAYLLMLGLLIAFPVWLVAWVRNAAQSKLPVRIDIALVWLCPLIVVLIYGRTGRQSSSLVGWQQTQWDVFNCHALALSIVGLASIALESILTRQNYVRRLFPFLVVELVNLSLVLWWLRDTSYDPLQVLVTQHLVVILFALVLQVLRMSGVRLQVAGLPGGSPAHEQMRLADFFILTFCVAALTWARALSQQTPVSTGVRDLIISTGGCVLLLVLLASMLSRKRYGPALAIMIGTAATAYLAIVHLAEWFWGQRLLKYWRSEAFHS